MVQEYYNLTKEIIQLQSFIVGGYKLFIGRPLDQYWLGNHVISGNSP